MPRKKSDTATIEDTDWSFASPDVLDIIAKRIRVRCANHEHLDPDDMEQEFLLWLAVRPDEQQSLAYIRKAVDFFIRDRGRTAAAQAARETSYEAMFDGKED